MKQNGVNSFTPAMSLCLIAIFLCGCTATNKMTKSGHFFRAFWINYFNDSAKFLIGMAGDYDSLPFKNYRKQIKPFHKRDLLFKKFDTFLFRAKTDIAPFFECDALIGKQNELPFYYENGFVENVINKNTFYQRLSSKGNKVIYETIIPLDKYDIYLVGIGNTKDNPGFTVEFLKGVIQDEYNMLLFNVKKGDKYSKEPPINPFQVADVNFDTSLLGDYLSPLRELRKLLALNSTNGLVKDFTLQALTTYSTFVNDPVQTYQYLEARKKVFQEDSINEPVKPADYSNLKYASAEPLIQKFATANQVLMFNESHFQPMHRVAVSELLPWLYKSGYRYLALECLNEDDISNNRRFPTQASGLYVREFRMANLIRTALNNGFKLISYDYENSLHPGQRELNQATNLYNKTLKGDPKAKVVVLAGHGHIYESGSKLGKKMMATYFKEISGVDPFTINQTEYNFFGKIGSSIPNGLYVVTNPDSTGARNNLYLTQKYDDTINEIYLGERDSARKEIDLPLPKTDESAKEKILLIYLSKELQRDSASVPCFAKQITTEDRLRIIIPDGEYVLYIKNEHGNMLDEKKFQVLQNKIVFR